MRVRTSKDGKQRVELTDMDRGALSKAASILMNIAMVEHNEECGQASATICNVLATRAGGSEKSAK